MVNIRKKCLKKKKKVLCRLIVGQNGSQKLEIERQFWRYDK
jgi:hypothetical protein